MQYKLWSGGFAARWNEDTFDMPDNASHEDAARAHIAKRSTFFVKQDCPRYDVRDRVLFYVQALSGDDTDVYVVMVDYEWKLTFNEVTKARSVFFNEEVAK